MTVWLVLERTGPAVILQPGLAAWIQETMTFLPSSHTRL